MNRRVRTFCFAQAAFVLVSGAGLGPDTAAAQTVRTGSGSDSNETGGARPLRADAEVVRELVEVEKALAALQGATETAASGATRASLLPRIREISARVARLSARIRGGDEIPSPSAPLPLADLDFERLLSALDSVPFAARRLALLADAVRHNPLTVHQLTRVLERFAFAAERLDAVRLAAPRLVDPELAFELQSAFPFEDDRVTLQKILENTARPAP